MPNGVRLAHLWLTALLDRLVGHLDFLPDTSHLCTGRLLRGHFPLTAPAAARALAPPR